MAASAVTPPLGGESIVNATWVIPRVSASNLFRTAVPSLLITENARSKSAHPPGATVPERQSLPGPGCVRLAVVVPGGWFLARSHIATGPLHKSEMSAATCTKGTPPGLQIQPSSLTQVFGLPLDPHPAPRPSTPTKSPIDSRFIMLFTCSSGAHSARPRPARRVRPGRARFAISGGLHPSLWMERPLPAPPISDRCVSGHDRTRRSSLSAQGAPSLCSFLSLSEPGTSAGGPRSKRRAASGSPTDRRPDGSRSRSCTRPRALPVDAAPYRRLCRGCPSRRCRSSRRWRLRHRSPRPHRWP